MADKEVFLAIGGVLVLLVILQMCAGSKKPIRGAVGAILTGWAALMAVNLTGAFTGVYLPISTLSIGISAAAGIPGVTMMILLDMIFL